jgi:predicted nucleic acid-binding protein
MSVEPVTYVDSSAIVKLAVGEAESDALRRYLTGRRPLVTSVLARTEVGRALLPGGAAGVRRGRETLARFQLVRLEDRILVAAASLRPVELRSLDAIHLATARELGEQLDLVVTYDRRMQAAAEALGIRVAAPA